jgi:hypothetical protein
MENRSIQMPSEDREDPADSAQRRQAIIAHMAEAQRLAALEGIRDVFRPGFLRQLIVSDALGHRPCNSWRDGPCDAYDPNDPERRFEYFAASDGKRFQAGVVRRSDWEAKKKSLYGRFEKTAAVYFAVFDIQEPLKLLRIYQIDAEAFRAAVERQITVSKSPVVNASFSERWAMTTGKLVYPFQSPAP